MQMYGPEDVVSWANESQTSLQPFAVASRIMVWRAEAGNRNLDFFSPCSVLISSHYTFIRG